MSLVDRLGASVYDLIMRRAEREHVADWRRETLREVSGDVIEIGAGTGANLPFYPAAAQRLTALEPSDGMRAQAEARPRSSALEASFHKGFAESIPWPTGRYDWAVATLVLCSVRSPARALEELVRVLKPGGRLAFVEHVLDPHDARNRERQRRYQPLWSLVTSTCQVTRDTEASIRAAGFTIEELAHEQMHVGPSIVRPVIRGIARAPR